MKQRKSSIFLSYLFLTIALILNFDSKMEEIAGRRSESLMNSL
ncbi:hypothetical protein [Mesotoga sp. B105.6.4]|nr:hypothetical protein [Mesotoga sp. B105.6.4]